MAGFGHSAKYYPPIIAVSHFAKVFSLQNFVSYGTSSQLPQSVTEYIIENCTNTTAETVQDKAKDLFYYSFNVNQEQCDAIEQAI